tara:strand:- start:1890 stop:4256 length:2367 start_codon:yes stop_codon:yes gene_type:complete
MNINLISPQTNGNNYTIRFKEDVIIPENSSVYLNFASLSRQSDIELFEDQTITFHFAANEVRPTNIPTAPYLSNAVPVANPQITITAGTYSYQSLYKQMTNKIQAMIDDAANTGNLEFYRAIKLQDIDQNNSQIISGEIDVSLGIIRNKVGASTFALHPTHKRNADQTDVGGEETVYRNTQPQYTDPNGQVSYDNYALSSKKYWHVGYNDNTPINQLNIITFETTQTIEELLLASGSVAIGLYSQNVASGLQGSNGNYPKDSVNRTGGNAATSIGGGGAANPQTLPNTTSRQHMVGHIICEIDGRSANPYLWIGFAQSGQSYDTSALQNFRSCNEKITHLTKAANIPLKGIYGSDYGNGEFTFKGGIQTYYEMEDLENKRLYWRIINFDFVNDPSKSIEENLGCVMYDSRTAATKSTFFPDSFFLSPTNDLQSTNIDYLAGKFSITPDPPTLYTGASGILNTAGVPTYGAHNTADKTDGDYERIIPARMARKNADGVYQETTNTVSNLKLNFTIAAGTLVIGSVLKPAGGAGLAVNSFKIRIGDLIQIPNNQGIGGTENTWIEVKSQEGDIRPNKYNSQTPFNVICAASLENGGFSSIDYPSYTEDNAKPQTHIQSYNMTATEELSRYLELVNTDDPIEERNHLYPNTGDAMNPNIVHLESMNIDWRNESYSIYINGLPIKNFKNNDKTRNGGFGKAILANIPVPFSDSQSYSTQTKQMITSTYKPNYQIVNNLYNKAISTNHFEVEIKKLTTDLPAKEIKKSVVNFTIMPPADYTGNLNSIKGVYNI